MFIYKYHVVFMVANNCGHGNLKLKPTIALSSMMKRILVSYLEIDLTTTKFRLLQPFVSFTCILYDVVHGHHRISRIPLSQDAKDCISNIQTFNSENPQRQ